MQPCKVFNIIIIIIYNYIVLNLLCFDSVLNNGINLSYITSYIISENCIYLNTNTIVPPSPPSWYSASPGNLDKNNYYSYYIYTVPTLRYSSHIIYTTYKFKHRKRSTYTCADKYICIVPRTVVLAPVQLYIQQT